MSWTDGVKVEVAYLRLKEWFFNNVDDLFELNDDEFLQLIDLKVRGVTEQSYTETEVNEMQQRLKELGEREKWSESMINARMKSIPNVGDVKWNREMNEDAANSVRLHLLGWFTESKERGVDVSELFDEGEEL